MAQSGHLLTRFKANATFRFLCVLFVTASTARAQVYEFQFITSAPDFGGELFFNAPSGSGPAGEVLYSDSFITTPDGTFTGSDSIVGGPLQNPPPSIVWSPAGITAMDVSLYESINSQLYHWSATPTTIGDSPSGGLPLDPSASGAWVYIGAVPEPGALPLTALGIVAIIILSIRYNSAIRRTLHLRRSRLDLRSHSAIGAAWFWTSGQASPNEYREKAPDNSVRYLTEVAESTVNSEENEEEKKEESERRK